MQLMLIAWLIIVVLIAKKTLSNSSAGLPLAFVLCMSFLYGGCFVYAVPGYTHLRPDGFWYLQSYNFTEKMIVEGTAVSLTGLIGFFVGTSLTGRRVPRLEMRRQALANPYERNAMVGFAMIAGLAMLLQQLQFSFPLNGAIFELGRNILVMLICLGAYIARRDGRSMLPWGMLAAIVPIYYMVSFGLASYGLIFGMMLTGFWFAQLRRRHKRWDWLKLTALSAVFLQAILTLFVGWMSSREEFRAIVWDGSDGSAFDILVRSIQETGMFSLADFAALDIVNTRLNLPLFIGRMMDQHSQNPDLQLWGSTLIVIPLSIVPRFLWPGKPERGGSDFMSEHTGITLSDNATFGSGSVFEFYANFGYLGVLAGFIVLGWLMRRIDMAAFSSLATGKYLDFARFYVIGLVALDPLLRPFFIFNGILFAWISMGLLKHALLNMERIQKTKERSMLPRQTGVVYD
jgi:hypothetical protein